MSCVQYKRTPAYALSVRLATPDYHTYTRKGCLIVVKQLEEGVCMC